MPTLKILMANQPVEFEARNHRPFYKRLKAGDFYGGNFEYDQETWELLKTVPDNAIWHLVAYWNDGDPVGDEKPEEKPKKEKKEPVSKGSFGSFWQFMFHSKQYQFDPSLWHVLGVDNAKGVKDKLYEIFGVTSMSQFSPDDFIEWASLRDLDTQVTMAQEAKVKTQGESA